MAISSGTPRREIVARLAMTREEIRRILVPPPKFKAPGAVPQPGQAFAGDGFPRSQTMKMLMSGRGVGTIGALLGGLILARPMLAFRLIRMLPAGTVARMMLMKAIAGWRARRA